METTPERYASLWYVSCDFSVWDAYFVDYGAALDYARATSRKFAPCTVSQRSKRYASVRKGKVSFIE